MNRCLRCRTPLTKHGAWCAQCQELHKRAVAGDVEAWITADAATKERIRQAIGPDYLRPDPES